MPNLYYTNSTGDALWVTLENWNTVADGSGDNAINIPWQGGAYTDYNLVDTTGGSVVTISGSIGNWSNTATATCDLNILGPWLDILGGTYTGSVSCSQIWGGTFYGSVFCEQVWGGTFYGSISFYLYNDSYGGDISNATSVSIQYGVWNGRYYFAGVLANGYIEYGQRAPAFNAYYIAGVVSTLDQNGTGTWNGRTYLNGQILPRNIVPSVTGEGKLGTPTKKWKEGHFSDLLMVGGEAVVITTDSRLTDGVTTAQAIAFSITL